MTDALEVLLVEDNPGDARLIEEMFRDAADLLGRIDLDGATPERSRLHHERELAAGLELLADSDVDVVLLDLGLPDSRGLDTLDAVVDAIEFTPVVVLTGLDDRDVGIRAIQRGAQDYLVKDDVTGDGLVRSIQHAIERANRKHERERHRQQLEALNHLNRISQDVTHAVITTSTREELERAVCERLVESDAYRFAWIGEVHRPAGRLTPRVTAGAEEGYLEEVTIPVDDGTTVDGPGAKAVRTREVQVVEDTSTDPAFEPWREQASERGFRSVAAVPITHKNVSYGVLAIYAGATEAFSEPETEILTRLGDVIGHAITAIERRDALVQDTVLQLEFGVEGVAEDLVALTAHRDCTLAFETLLHGDDGLLAYGHAEGVPPEVVHGVAERSDVVEDFRVLSTGPESFEFELLTGAVDGLVTAVATHGGNVTGATMADGESRFVIEFPPGRDKHQLVDLVADHCASAAPTAQRTVKRDATGGTEARADLREHLTEKQRAALETAVYAGYFDWPRTSTGEEVADRLGITPATFSQHLRAAERKVFDALIDSTSEADGLPDSPWMTYESDAADD